jgi:uncharacterized protein YjbI with pentapeptide repeats
MIARPERALVSPRVRPADGGEAVRLEQRVLGMLAAGVRGVVYLSGPAGSGKSTALEHLSAVLPPDAPVILLDEDTGPEAIPSGPERLVIRAERSPSREVSSHDCQLARWTDDDWIEYLLATHHDRCGEILARLPDRERLQGNPELCVAAMEATAADADITGVSAALRQRLESLLPTEEMFDRGRVLCLNALTDGGFSVVMMEEFAADIALPIQATRLLRHRVVQLLLATERVIADLRGREPCSYLSIRLPRELIQAVGTEIAGDAEVLQYLRDLLAGDFWSHAMAASLLHAASPSWAPQPGQWYILTGAYLDRVAWAGADLSQITARDADFSYADLTGAKLDGMSIGFAKLRHARLARASVHDLRAIDADLTGADLSEVSGEGTRWDGATLRRARLVEAVLPRATFRGADLRNAVLARADLRDAILTGARLTGADFTKAILYDVQLAHLSLGGAIFSGAELAGADLTGCDLKGMDLAGVDLSGACLAEATLTFTVLRDADLTRARLRDAWMGGINLERACLRDADLRRVTFHMGSSRSGLVSSPLACEGSRTGFYTDDADEQYFKSPEEIRKANLRWADLRGARIEGVDFYLVDLRGALYDPDQEAHFRRCRAILDRPQ